VGNNLKRVHTAEDPVSGEEERVRHHDEAREGRKPKSIGDDIGAQVMTRALVMALEDGFPIKETKQEN
jgi:hypothetical protein